MLYALGHPGIVVGLVAGFVLACLLHAIAQAFTAARLGLRRPAAEGRISLDPKRQLDPFACVAAALAGPGWPRPVETGARVWGGRSWRPVLALAVGPLVSAALGVGWLLAGRAAGLPRGVLGLAGFTDLSDLLHGHGSLASFGLLTQILVGGGVAALAVGFTSLVPLPPLDAGRALFAVAPRTNGWLRAEHWLVEQNIGLVAVIVLLVIPLAGEGPLLLGLLDTVARPLLHAVGSV